MKTRELIDALSKLNPEAEVKLEVACVVNDDLDWLWADVEKAYEGNGIVVVQGNGISEEDARALEEANRDDEEDNE